MQQQTDEWRHARLGKLTASRFSDVTARNKSNKDGWGASRHKYINELVLERLNQEPTPEGFSSWEMKRGRELEPIAREVYATIHDVDVMECGFVDHPTIPMAGASPDGLIGEDGLIEVKCLGTHYHMEVIRTDNIDSSYLAQMMWQMACTGRQWCDYVGYDDRLPMKARLYVRRIKRDPMVIELMEKEARRFLADVDAREEEYRARYDLRAA